MTDPTLPGQFPAPDQTPDLLVLAQSIRDQFGADPPARTRNRSRKSGHKPNARTHVENFILNVGYGWTVRVIAGLRGRNEATIRRSIEQGRQLAQSGAAERGFSDPREPGRRLVKDDEAPGGFSDPDADPWSLD